MPVEQCISRCIQDVGKNLSSGSAEFKIPRYEPYDLKESYRDTFSYVYAGYAKLKNIKITGISDYNVYDFE